MKKFEKLTCVFSFALAAVSAVMYAVFFNKNALRTAFMISFIAAALVFLVMVFIAAKRKKTIKRFFSPLLRKIRAIYQKAARKLKIFLPKTRDDKKSYVLGKDEIKLRFAFFSREKSEKHTKPKPKLPKYETLKTDKERVRHLYTLFLLRKAERGYRIDPSLTPSELGIELAGGDVGKTLFEAYPEARYADGNDISKETIEYLEKNIEH